MRFDLRLRITDDGGGVVEHDVFAFARAKPALETLGMTLEEGKKLLKAVQQSVLEAQAAAFAGSHQACADCGRRRLVRGSRRISFSTLFGEIELRSPRLLHCDCISHRTKSFSPLSTLLTERCHPELVHLETKWACLMSYGLTAKLIKDVLPVNEKLNAVSIRKHVFAVAERLEQALSEPLAESPLEPTPTTPSSPPTLSIPDGPMTVGIDGGYVRAQRKQGFFEVIAGKSLVAFKRDIPEEQDSSSSRCFAFVQTFDQNHKQRFLDHLSSHGLTAGQRLEFFSDGGESVRGLQKHLSPTADHILDWFHVAMRLTVLGQYAKSLSDAPELPQIENPSVRRDDVLADLESVKHYLWHGNSFRALEVTDGLLLDLDVPEPPDDTKKLLKGLLEFRTYIQRNRGLIVNYGERYRRGDRISTAFVESAINQVVAKRFSKKQSMQWSTKGAHQLLQVRTRVLNGDLEAAFRGWYPACTNASMPPPETDVRQEIHPQN